MNIYHKIKGEVIYMKVKKHLFIITIVSLVFIIAACGQEADVEEEDKGSEKTESSADLEGSVVIDGSGTVFPLMSRIAEEYMTNEQENVSVEVSRAGTSAGFEKFLVED